MSAEQGPSQEKGDSGAKETAIEIAVVEDVDKLKEGPDDCLQYSFFAAFCCCFACGIPAVLFSRKVQDAKQRGDMATARQASTYSKRFTAASIVCGMLLWYIFMFYIIFANFSF
ncbi:proline rich transmembrane protein 1B-like isoform X2 [Ptychodera flava]|uniref:proline rich transmembrane protein 1B-like isoform X2 n=1 Tax=Ptychodera flava TaxID=63121 RepID=UPI00396A78CC